MIKYGNNSIGTIYLGSSKIGKAYFGSNLVFGGGGSGPSPSPLPSGYTKLTYVETPLYTQAYINTGIAASDNIGFEIDAMTYDAISNTTYGCLFGGRAGSNSSDFQLSTYIANGSSNQGTLRRGTSSENYNAHLPRAVRFQASLSGTTFTVDSTDYTTASSISSGQDIYLFALNDNGTAAQFGHLRVYSFKLTSSGTTVLNYVPCRRDSDDTVGFYDLVANSFVAPDSGTLLGVNESTETGEENNYTWGKGGIYTPGQSSGNTNDTMSIIGNPLNKETDNISLFAANGYKISAIFFSGISTSPTSAQNGTYVKFTELLDSITIPSGVWYQLAITRTDGENADTSEGYKSLLVK